MHNVTQIQPVGATITLRRDGRVDYRGGLENRYVGDGVVGSNPTPSANINRIYE